MRPAQFHAESLVSLLRQEQIATMDQLKSALGTAVDMTVFRKLREIPYHTSYSHRGRYYALDEVARFDRSGLWSCRDVHFSRHGSLVETADVFVRQAERGLFAGELVEIVHVDVEGPLLQLVRDHRLVRERMLGAYLYCAVDPAQRTAQIRARETDQAPEARVPRDVSLEECKAAIVLFAGLLDERQRRLFVGLESMLHGWGGDRRLAQLTGLDVHTIAKGRRELAEAELVAGGVRRPGGGRKPVEKKRLT